MTSADPLPHPYFRPAARARAARIFPPQLRALIEGAAPPLLLDVRSERERAAARLPADRHIPLPELPRRLVELPRDRPIVAYDHHGSDAARAAELLRDRGFPLAASLEGGIDEYATQADPEIGRYSDPGPADGLFLAQLPRPATGCLAYLVGDRETRTAAIVDPGHEIEPYLARLADGGWRLRAIVETHTHADHLAGHAGLHLRTGAPIYVSRRSPARYPHEPLEEGQSIELGGSAAIEVLETPGHTRDHLTLRCGSAIFTGDTLLIGSCGRTDLGDGSPERLYESLEEKLLRLPNETEVYPAHYGARHALVDRWVSTIGFERATNEALRQPDRAAFLRYMTEGWPPKPADFESIVAANLAE